MDLVQLENSSQLTSPQTSTSSQIISLKMESLQHSYKPILRILRSRVAVKAKGEVELVGGGENRKTTWMEGKESRREDRKGGYERKEEILPQYLHSYLHPTHKVTWDSGLSIRAA